MPTILLFALITIALTGLLLIAWGRRGRRINDHPQCRDCGFDLQGVFPASITCPECGSGLKRTGAVRTGVRRRNPMIFTSGVLAILLAAAPLVLFAYAAMTGTNLNSYKPLGMLLLEARFASPTASSQIAAEILDRATLKKLTPDQERKAALTALAMQADPVRPWHEAWGDLFQRLSVNGSTTQEQQNSFQQNAPQFELSVRPSVCAGHPLPIFITPAAFRCGSSDNFQAEYSCVSVRLEPGGIELKEISPVLAGLLATQAERGIDLQSNAWIHILGSTNRARWGGMHTTRLLIARTIPQSVPPGQYTATATVAVRATGAGGGPRVPVRADSTARRLTLSVPVAITPHQADAGIQTVEPTPQLEKSLADVLGSDGANILQGVLHDYTVTTPGKTETSLMFSLNYSAQIKGAAPVDFCFDVFARVDGAEVRLGEIASGDGLSLWKPGQPGVTYLSAGQQHPRIPKSMVADVIFRPRPKLARYTTDLTSVYNGEITLKDVPITINDSRQDKSVPLDKVVIKRPSSSVFPFAGD